MSKLRFILYFAALVFAVSAGLSCGSSQGQGQLQSITLNPATADATEVQFTATGHYVNPSHTVTPQPVAWTACYQGSPTTDVLVAPGGLVECSSKAAGAYTIYGFDQTSCNVITECGGGCTIVGTAQLTCP
jgi:hypothetical protein